ncbi:glycosyltransferase family 39 protein [Coniophora puteana RWD-64-598 SS2]|uniref:Dolichyl-phosphate-mannose--protein mannosyltransferase n=1 Tax=Coniophora puteana (strain RWD-64-598) TaxID=741705 RepID=A0A5M3MZX2_CONPW|nr:glycosyltransferase family 39 protein [Coniophora puteana RWD-64-598 SS2]EIW84678.1 glycosyltransferase family 39 protein [Coniophora puteana RWD-64-598 SS2]
MRPDQVHIDFGTPEGPTPRTSDEYEQVSYPSTHNHDHQHHHTTHTHTHRNEGGNESLPLHYMSEETARRRVAKGPGNSGGFMSGEESEKDMPYDDTGKDVYSKMRPGAGVPRVSSGRVHRPPPPPPTSITEYIHQNMDIVTPIFYTLLSCWSRFRKIGLNDHVVWDEAHFGKFGSYYLRREFYFDVHPPLGKMLVGFAGALVGYDGSFQFESGAQYTENVPYVAWRVVMSMFGVALVPIAWFTAVELGMSQFACHVVALMVLCDVGWLVISRFILLDSMLLFFTFTTVFFLAKFHNEQHHSFSFDWWMWLTLTGFSIGCVCSVKWVGLFVTSVVGLYTIEDLWEKFGDLRLSNRQQIRHWGARITCLITIPILVYMASFKLHFMILNHSGTGDAQMSSLFQAHLVGNDFATNPLEVAYGSRITLKNMGWGGGLLHSHVQTYPTGSEQQQVTCYHYKDNNNEWNILPRWDEPAFDPNSDMRFLKHGDIIRLQHGPSTRNLHSHEVAGPITKVNYEVSCYGNATVGDYHDYWVVEVLDDIKQGKREHVEKIHALTTRLRFRHSTLGCYLHAGTVPLPQWGFKQIETTCIKENDPSDAHTIWNVEGHWNDRLPPADATYHKSPFLRDFWHLNVAMMTSNNALMPDVDKEDILASVPTDWPLMRLGLRMCGWGDEIPKYYLIGTPIVWWGSFVAIIISVFVLGAYLLRWQRKYVDMDAHEWGHFLYVGKIAFYGWFLHYIPFFIMGRVTYVHHYLPTLYFAVLMFGHVFDHFFFSSRRLSTKTKRIVFGVVTFLIVANFWWFRGLAWGMEGPINDHWGLQWRKSWNIYNI